MSSIRKRGESLADAAARRPRAAIARPKGRQGDVSVLAIGASTGGPPALQAIFEELPGDIPFSVVVSQHMPAGFTRAFAERLNRIAAFSVTEASDGDPLRPGTALIAPGGRNMVFQQSDGEVRVRLLEPQASDHCIPSVDRMFRSCAEIFGPHMLGVVLTGMGSDGSLGVRAIKEAGGQVVSESEETAVIFGMPRAAIATGMVDAVVPLEKISEEIMSRCGTGGDRF
jgi:two-component system chemotaxis response regulator CheB